MGLVYFTLISRLFPCKFESGARDSKTDDSDVGVEHYSPPPASEDEDEGTTHHTALGGDQEEEDEDAISIFLNEEEEEEVRTCVVN